MKLTQKIMQHIVEIYKLNQKNKPAIANRISRLTDTTPTCSIKVIKKLEENDIIIRKSKGRNKEITLTEKGKESYHAIMILRQLGFE